MDENHYEINGSIGRKNTSTFKVLSVILGLLLFSSVICAITIQSSNTDLKNNLLLTSDELNSKNIVLQEKVGKLNSIELFIRTILKADGKFYSASDDESSADSKYSLAGDYYASSSYDDAIQNYGDAMTYYNNAGQKYRDTAIIYKNAGNYTSDTTYKNLCNVEYNMCTSGSKLMYYMYEAAEYMESACQYYKNGDYDSWRL